VSGEGRRLDLDRLVRKGTVELAAEEHADERASRLRREERRERVELWKGTVLFLVALAGVLAVGAVAGYAAFLAAGVDEPTRQRAHTLLVAVVSGGVSFLVGRGLSKG
jgi:hypothetical protein